VPRRFVLLPVHLALGGYVAGLGMALYWRPGVAAVVMLGAAAAGTAALSLTARRRATSAVVLACAVAALFAVGGLLVGGHRLDAIGASALAPRIGSRADAEITLTGLATRGRGKLSMPARVTTLSGGPVDEPTRLTIWLDGGEDVATLTDSVDGLSEGLRLAISRARIEALPPAPDDGFDYGRYLRRRGVHALLSCDPGDVRILGRRGGPAALTDALRRAAREHLGHGVRSPVKELLQGMVLGDDANFDEAIAEDFRAAGLMHIMAVSGENVVLVCSLAGALLSALGIGRRLRLAVLLPAIAAYVVIAGASPSIVRAGIAGGLVLLAGLASRPGDAALLLLLPAAVMLSINPATVFDVGFQLSFAAVAGLFFLAGRLGPLFRLLPGPLREAGAMTTAASLATAPISLAQFGQVSLVSLPANLAGCFVLGPVMFLGMASAALGFVWSGLSAALNTVAGVAIGFLVSVAHLFASVPGATYTWQGVTLGVVLVALTVVALVALPALAARRGVGVLRFLLGGRLRGAPLLLAAAVLAAALILTPGAPAGPAQPTVSFLDVGEGSATLIQSPGGDTVLVDGGPAPLSGQLREHGVRGIDLLIVSHGHADHIAGIESIIGSVPIEEALLPLPPTGSASLDQLARQLTQAGASVRRCTQPATLSCAPFTLQVVPTHAQPEDAGDTNQAENDEALVVVLSAAGDSVLIPGDAEAAALNEAGLPPCEVVAAPHHGSAEGLDDELMAALDPDLVVISVGADNTYGHPAPQTLAECAEWGAGVLRTDLVGDVDLVVSVEGLTVKTDVAMQ